MFTKTDVPTIVNEYGPRLLERIEETFPLVTGRLSTDPGQALESVEASLVYYASGETDTESVMDWDLGPGRMRWCTQGGRAGIGFAAS